MLFRCSLPTLLVVAAGFAASAQATSIGVASNYNILLFGNANISSDVEGSVAVGGILSGSSTIGSLANTTVSAADLIVDGGVTGHVNLNHGSAFVGATHTGVSFNGGAGAGYLSSDPLGSIASYSSFYQSLADQLFSTSNEVTNGAINVTGAGCTICTVYLSATDFANLSSIQYAAVTQTLIINVGGNPTFGSGQHLSINGSQPSNQSTAASGILFNFDQATTVQLNGAFFGSILAPDATISGSGTITDGTIIANSLSGLGEIHDESGFTGTLPTQTPEPSSAYMFGGGALAVLGMLRFRRKQSPAVLQSVL